MTVGEQGQDTKATPRWLRRVACAFGALVLGCLVAFACGFAWFVQLVPVEEVTLDRKADGIVVLTGGASRVSDAIELLAAGRGTRLLISGVHPGTTATEIARQMPGYEKIIAERVDLDYLAVNTVGNALGTKRWVREQGFRSLIVVTSSYHMPRTLIELSQQMPDIELVPFPVVTDRMRNEPWWASAPTAKLMFYEYAKYVVALLRTQIGPLAGVKDIGAILDTRRASKS